MINGKIRTKNMLLNLSHTVREFISIQKAQWLSEDQLQKIQWQRFKNILSHAYQHTVFYKKRFDEAGITPDLIKDKRDLKKIPITTREDLKSPDLLVAANYSQKFLKASTSSGSSGRRTTTYFDDKAWLIGKYLLKLRAKLACGVRPWDKIAVLSEAESTSSRVKEILLRRKLIYALDYEDVYVKKLEAYDATAIYGFPSTLRLLAQRSLSTKPQFIFTSSEMLDQKTRKRIERGFDAEVFDIYGCTEVKEISWECPSHQGYHINSDWLLVEFSRENRENSGIQGKILVTSLYNYGMPLLRYEVGDTGRLLEKKCSCGRRLPLMMPSLGRRVDYFRLLNGSLISPYKMTCAIENIEGMKQYQIHQQRRDMVLVKVVPDTNFSQGVIAKIKAALQPVLPEVAIAVKTVPHIAKEKNRKYKIVKSDVINEHEHFHTPSS